MDWWSRLNVKLVSNSTMYFSTNEIYKQSIFQSKFYLMILTLSWWISKFNNSLLTAQVQTIRLHISYTKPISHQSNAPMYATVQKIFSIFYIQMAIPFNRNTVYRISVIIKSETLFAYNTIFALQWKKKTKTKKHVQLPISIRNSRCIEANAPSWIISARERNADNLVGRYSFDSSWCTKFQASTYSRER